jgi:predicted amidophosphoribosyltransferase
MKTNIKTIDGNWDDGIVLDKHVLSSAYTGDNEYGRPTFNTSRSEIGEALYQLKYRQDWSQVPLLGAEAANAAAARFGKIGFIVPMPPSNSRPRQPVFELADAVGASLEVPVFKDMLVRQTAGAGAPQLKDLGSKDEKIAALEGRFTLAETITNEGKWDALVVDDLFDSGASMEVACRVLRPYVKIQKLYVLALTWK